MHLLFEAFCEITSRAEADALRYLGNVMVGCREHLHALMYAVVDKVRERRRPKHALKDTAAFALAYVVRSSYFGKRYAFHVIFVYECRKRFDSLFVAETDV